MFSQEGYGVRERKNITKKSDNVGSDYIKEKQNSRHLITPIKKSDKNTTQAQRPAKGGIIENKHYGNNNNNNMQTVDEVEHVVSNYADPYFDSIMGGQQSTILEVDEKDSTETKVEDPADDDVVEKKTVKKEEKKTVKKEEKEEEDIEKEPKIKEPKVETSPKEEPNVNKEKDDDPDDTPEDTPEDVEIKPEKTEAELKKDREEHNFKVDIIKKFNGLIGVIDRINTKMDVFKHKDELVMIQNQKTFSTLQVKIDITREAISSLIIDKAYDLEFEKLSIIYTHYKAQVLLLSEIFLNIFVDVDTKNKISDLNSIRN